MDWRLRNADRTLRLFITAFLLVVTAGYAIGLLFVDHTTSGTPAGISSEFRGNDGVADAAREEGVAGNGDQAELKFEKSPRELYTFLHNHVFSLSVLFFCVGAIFYRSSVPDGLKTFLIVEPFAAIVTTFGGIWLLRFVSPAFSWLVLASGISMLACYSAMLFLILKELWLRR
jgi:hypothetical protein